MLANRADTYNLGDIIGGNAEWFQASYLENAVTSMQSQPLAVPCGGHPPSSAWRDRPAHRPRDSGHLFGAGVG